MVRKGRKELFLRYRKNPILTAENWPYEAHSVFNPAATMVGNITVLMVRIADFKGFSHITVAKSKNGTEGWEIDPEPTLTPDPANYPEEIYGIEDPCITHIDELETLMMSFTPADG